MHSQTWTLTVSATGKAMTKLWGQAGSGVEFDEPIARSAADWIRDRNGDSAPWFLSVGLVNPHDVMWFPMDQPWYQQEKHCASQSIER